MTTEKKNYCGANGLCSVVMDDYVHGTDCRYYMPDNHNSCIYASWGLPVQCTNEEAREDARKNLK